MTRANNGLMYDLTYLKDASQDDPEFIKKLVSMFIDIMPCSIAELNEYFKSGDLIHVRKTAHKMKSSVDLLGINYLGDTLRRIEYIADNDPTLEKHIAIINAGMPEVLAQLNELI